MPGLTSIADRLTPSVPIELTFAAQPIAVGRKFTTLLAHKSDTAMIADYDVYQVVNVADPVAAKAEVELMFGVDSEAAKMAYAFVACNAFAGRSNYPAFRIVAIPESVQDWGPANEALEAIKLLRSDMIVSPYEAGDPTTQDLQDFTVLISGPDRDLSGQFGSFFTVGSLAELSVATLYAINSRYGLVAYLQDTNTELLEDVEVDTVSGSDTLAGITTTQGIYVGAVVTGAGIPVGSKIIQVFANQVRINNNASATASNILVDIQNQVSQSYQEVAAAHAAGMLASAFPYNPLQGVALGFLKAPQKKSDWIVIDPNGASEVALTGGLSPLTILPGGVVGYIRTRTTFTTLPGNIAATAYFDWQDLVVMNDFREVTYQVTQNPPFNNNPGGTKASKTIAARLKDEILREAFNFQDLGAFQGVKTLSPLFLVEPSTTSRGRFDFKIPVNIIPGLYVIAGNIQGVSDIGNFQL